jgi:hypothetical protein
MVRQCGTDVKTDSGKHLVRQNEQDVFLTTATGGMETAVASTGINYVALSKIVRYPSAVLQTASASKL